MIFQYPRHYLIINSLKVIPNLNFLKKIFINNKKHSIFMISEEILVELRNLSMQDEITKSQLLEILKKYARTITVYDLMRTSQRMRKEGEYLDEDYREQFLEIYIKNFILRITELVALEDYDDAAIDKESFDETFPILERMFEKEELPGFEGDKFPLFYVIISLYVTYITEEPIHHVGSEFPGNLKVEEINGEYFCPVKEKHMDNVNATCHYCIAKQNPNI